MKVKLLPATNKNKKYKVIIYSDASKKLKTIQFGSRGMNDYTIHNDEKLK